MGSELPPGPLTVVIPVYNDWVPALEVLRRLDPHLAGRPARILLIDDGSTEPLPDGSGLAGLRNIACVEVLRLRRNLGHQRALAVGLTFVESSRRGGAVVVMDGDGEDDPADVPRLLDRLAERKGDAIVFAERTRRSEGPVFRAGYAVYRVLHLLLTGHSVRVGNFSALPFAALSRLVVVSDLWNHYAASVFKSRLPFVTIPTHRGTRLGGRSQMNFVSLVVHGLAAISVFADRVGARLLVLLAALCSLVGCGIGMATGVRLLTDLAIPGWATTATGVLSVLLLQMLTLIAMTVFLVLGGRDNSKFLPIRDASYFIMGVERLAGSDG